MVLKYHILKTSQSFIYIFSQEIINLENGAEVVVTNFEKTPNVIYDKGESKHIEAFMDTWKSKIKSGCINVKQIVHVFSEQDIDEAKKRAKFFNTSFNFSISAMVGMPINPYYDFAVVNLLLLTTLLGFSRDQSAPHDLAFGIAIRDETIASEFEKVFNIYWSNHNSTIIKSKDGLNINNTAKLEFFSIEK